MKSTALPDLFYWSEFQPARGIDFNGFYWRRASGVLFDPMPLTADDAVWLGQQSGGIDWIVVTNAQHLRAAVELRERFDARILAPAGDQEALGDVVDLWFSPETPLPDALADVTIRWIRGGKTSAEAVVLLPKLGAILFGDAVRSHASGVLRLLPDDKMVDAGRVAEDVIALAAESFEAVLLGDGDCLFTGGRTAFDALVARLRAAQ